MTTFCARSQLPDRWTMLPLNNQSGKTNSLKPFFPAIHTVRSMSSCNFILNSKIHSRKITSNEYFKGTLHYFRVNSLSGLMVDQIDLWSRAETGQSLIWLISHIAWRGKNQFIVGLPQCNMNSKLHISGKSKVLMVKSRTEMYFQKNKHILLAEGCKIVYEVRHRHRQIFFYLDFRSHFLL